MRPLKKPRPTPAGRGATHRNDSALRGILIAINLPRSMAGPDHKTRGTYTVSLSARAARQLEEFPPPVSTLVQARLHRLADRSALSGEGANPLVRGQLIGKAFRAVYEVDHAEARVTVLDVTARA